MNWFNRNRYVICADAEHRFTVVRGSSVTSQPRQQTDGTSWRQNNMAGTSDMLVLQQPGLNTDEEKGRFKAVFCQWHTGHYWRLPTSVAILIVRVSIWHRSIQSNPRNIHSTLFYCCWWRVTICADALLWCYFVCQMLSNCFGLRLILAHLTCRDKS